MTQAPTQAPTVEGFRPAYISEDAKKAAWAERSAGGFPLPSTEWQDKGKEKKGWVGNAPVQNAVNGMYTAQGQIVNSA
jgi:hypothetical protein